MNTHCVYNFLKVPFKFPDKCFGFSLELVDEFTKIVPSAYYQKGPKAIGTI